MSYKNYYLQAKDAAAKIRSGEFKQEQVQKAATVDPNVLISRRPGKDVAPYDPKKAEEDTFQDMILMYMQSGKGAEEGAMPVQGGGSGGGNVDVSGSDAQTVIAGLVARGMPEHLAKGFAVNFKDESNFNPGAIGDSGNSLGVAQWYGPRKKALESFASKVGGSPTNLDIQLDYLMHELDGDQKGAWNKISQAKTPSEAAVAVLNHFEKPAEKHRVHREAKYKGSS